MNKPKVENGEVIEDYKSAFIVSDEAQTHLSYPCYVSAFQDECFQDFITNALNQQRGELVEKFKEVIGEDEKNLGSHDREGNLDMDDWSIGFRNQLREEQKAKLESF